MTKQQLKRHENEQRELEREERVYRMALSRIPGMKQQIKEMPYDNSEISDIQTKIDKLMEIIEIYENAKINAVDINIEDYESTLEEIKHLKFQVDYIERNGAAFVNPKTLEFKYVEPKNKEANIDDGDER